MSSRDLIAASGYDREGFAARYDRYRPAPPRALLDVLCRYARVERPALVVDLGCGTGLSTRAWSGRAERVVGVEPNPAMLAAAEPAPGVEYREAYAHETGLEDACAAVVTCSQSFHWMEPEPTLAEVGRVLRPGGVFAGSDGVPSLMFRILHFRDTCNPVPPETLPDRLRAAGFQDVDVKVGTGRQRWRAVKAG